MSAFQLELGYLVDKLTAPEYPLARWPLALAKEGLLYYQRFLQLMVIYGPEGLVPTRDIDEFWHAHILFTKEYIADCHHLVGHYIHHAPADPANPEEVSQLTEQFERTKTLYLKEFGEPLRVLDRP